MAKKTISIITLIRLVNIIREYSFFSEIISSLFNACIKLNLLKYIRNDTIKKMLTMIESAIRIQRLSFENKLTNLVKAKMLSRIIPIN